jgi:uroporphyrinogen-III synthase
LNHFSKIILTRPRVQNLKLKNKLENYLLDQGIHVDIHQLPLLEIVPILDETLANSIYKSLVQASWVSFVSPNAFLMADQLLKAFNLHWPTGLNIAVVGGGSEKSIRDSGLDFRSIVKPIDNSAWDSEGLWEALQVQQQDWQNHQVVIVHGQGGRTFLTKHLTSAGAKVEEFVVYQRQNLGLQDAAWQDLIRECEIKLKPSFVWMFSSSQAAQSLAQGMQELGLPMSYLEQSVAFVSHPRIEEAVKKLGFKKVLMILPGDDELLQSLGDILKTGL